MKIGERSTPRGGLWEGRKRGKKPRGSRPFLLPVVPRAPSFSSFLPAPSPREPLRRREYKHSKQYSCVLRTPDSTLELCWGIALHKHHKNCTYWPEVFLDNLGFSFVCILIGVEFLFLLQNSSEALGKLLKEPPPNL